MSKHERCTFIPHGLVTIFLQSLSFPEPRNLTSFNNSSFRFYSVTKKSTVGVKEAPQVHFIFIPMNYPLLDAFYTNLIQQQLMQNVRIFEANYVRMYL